MSYGQQLLNEILGPVVVKSGPMVVAIVHEIEKAFGPVEVMDEAYVFDFVDEDCIRCGWNLAEAGESHCPACLAHDEDDLEKLDDRYWDRNAEEKLDDHRMSCQ